MEPSDTSAVQSRFGPKWFLPVRKAQIRLARHAVCGRCRHPDCSRVDTPPTTSLFWKGHQDASKTSEKMCWLRREVHWRLACASKCLSIMVTKKKNQSRSYLNHLVYASFALTGYSDPCSYPFITIIYISSLCYWEGIFILYKNMLRNELHLLFMLSCLYISSQFSFSNGNWKFCIVSSLICLNSYLWTLFWVLTLKFSNIKIWPLWSDISVLEEDENCLSYLIQK